VIPASWYAPLPSFLWQVLLHSSIMGLIFYTWAHAVALPSGQTKRRLLAMLLVLPLFTAAIPGRTAVEFRERIAWLNSGRVLAVPIGAGFHLYHLVLLVALMMMALTIWQELLPMLSQPRTSAAAVPEQLAQLVRSLPGWDRCRVVLSPSEAIMLATGGLPHRPRLIVSRGAMARLTDEELATVLGHEYAHWQAGRWFRSHALFLVRLLQCYNPVALWAFREYCVEVEIGCDRAAVAGRNPNLLIRILLRLYETTDRRDVSTRSALRKRVDVLLAGGPEDDALPPLTIVAAAVVMLMVLPWIV
jgi:hypothetical protein